MESAMKLQVRLWRVVRSQAEILASMRRVEGLEGAEGLVAWWRFNEPGGWMPVQNTLQRRC